MKFRPCIDLHAGAVKQIVGSSLTECSDDAVVTNFTATEDASFFARLYQSRALVGGHVIMLGPGNSDAALSALRAYPQGLHIGGTVAMTAYVMRVCMYVCLCAWHQRA